MSAAVAALLAASVLSSVPAMSQTVPAVSASADQTDDPFLWLEEIEGERAMAWVHEHNARTFEILQGDPRYADLHAQALAVVESRERIPFASFRRDGRVSNFWQDADHVRGIWRLATRDGYRTEAPGWDTVLDVDALAAAEGRNWVFKGASCLDPDERLCLVSLSDGGKDAVTVREYDLEARAFVEGGIVLEESKGSAAWIDADTLLIARDFGPGTLTTSEYPRQVRLLRRGQSPDQAPVVFEGRATDVSVGGYALRDADGAVKAVLLTRAVDFYESETWRLTDDGATVRLPLPGRSEIEALVRGWLVVSVKQDWTAPSGQDFRTGDVIAWPLDAWLADPAVPARLVIRPTERQAVEGITATRNRLAVALYDNVRGAIQVFAPTDQGDWPATRLDLPANVSVGLVSASDTDDRLFASVNGYLDPSSLWLADAATGAAERIKSLPAQFDATGLTVDQFEARSADGTLVPYFVVRRPDQAADGSNPALLYGYGGFEVSLLPGYSGAMGRRWLARGGTDVVANTRGGGEFGPRWHQAAQGANRQRAHEDFQAVAEDLIARGITSPRRLGIMGGSQGGLFMGAMLTQRPDLINAAVIQVPLFDMLRFHRLLAGASWIAEYGDPDIPEQRAWIEEYSPYQRLSAGQPYPEVFIHTSTKDDRVHPGHARKAAARLEALGYPVLFYENVDGGHGAAANLRETARRLALEYTYLSRRLMD